MNHRQWKKNYKKKHGCNPPLTEDKRKQTKALKRTFKQISMFDVEDLVKKMVNGLSNAFRIIGEQLTNIGNAIKIE